MAEITAAMVKELRDRTNLGMMDCKNALTEAKGNMDEAIKLLRERGAIKSAKREGRAASEGLVGTATAAGGKAGVAVYITSETDFAARNDAFEETVKLAVAAAAAAVPADIDALKAAKTSTGKTVDAVVEDLRHKIGEKIEVGAYGVQKGDVVVDYKHFNGKIAVLVAADAPGLDAAKAAQVAETLKGVAMHIAANNPRFLDSTSIDEKTLAEEKEIAATQAKNEGKPENIIPKIVEGKIRAFYKQACLVDQPFAMDTDKTVAQIVKDLAKAVGAEVKLTGFTRIEAGASNS